jgi:cytochrome c heme-lyase
VAERDMDTVIAIHNNMNENTWNQVLEWEKIINDPSKAEPGRESKLLKFCGRPDEYSPKARLKMLFGHPAPFDRHDWTIDRGGKEVRYIIDYYHDESAVQKDKTPQHMTDPKAMQSIKVTAALLVPLDVSSVCGYVCAYVPCRLNSLVCRFSRRNPLLPRVYR